MGVTELIPVCVGLHQDSVLSPNLCVIKLDIVTENVRKEAPGCIMFADDVM